MEKDKDKTARDDNGQPVKHREPRKEQAVGREQAQVTGQHSVGTAGTTRQNPGGPHKKAAGAFPGSHSAGYAPISQVQRHAEGETESTRATMSGPAGKSP